MDAGHRGESAVNRMSRMIVCALALAAVLAPRAAVAQVRTDAAPPQQVQYRAGTAASPFPSSSAIADFDADGSPDIAIADRTTRTGGGYTIEVQLAKGSTQLVPFVSTSGALDVTVFDIDNDHDADLVVTPVLSRDIVGVWLNDGSGHFNEGYPDSYAPREGTLGGAASLSGFADQPVTIVSIRRLFAFGLTAGPPAASLDRNTTSRRRTDIPLPAGAVGLGLSTRAPPADSRC